MRFVTCLCALLVVVVFVTSVDARKTFSTRRKSGNNRRGGTTGSKHKQPTPSVTPQKVDSFLAAERAGSHGHGSSGTPAITNTHYRGSPFDNKPKQPVPQTNGPIGFDSKPKQTVPQTNGPIGFDNKPKQTVPQTNGPIGFEQANHGNPKPIGFDKVNSEVQHKSASSNVPSAPAYPGKTPSQPSAPPAYPGLANTGHQGGSLDAPPAYPGRPVNAPPVYSANPGQPSYPGQHNYQGQPSYPGQQNLQGQHGYPGQQNYQGQHGYPGQQNYQGQHGYPGQQNYQGQHGYPGQQNYPGQNYPGYSNTGGSLNGYPAQGFGSGGFGSYSGGSHSNMPAGAYSGGFGGNPYGGSPFGNSNPYGGGSFGGQPQFGGSGFGGNPHYSPNNFGFSNNPGLFGSSPYPGYSGNYGNFVGQRKKPWYSGLPIPIPIPIPIPLGGGGFGGLFGGRSNNHRVLDTFIKNQTINTSSNETASVYILNNSTVTPCTTDQFIYDSLNVTVISCTAGNCTAIKLFTTTNATGEVKSHSAGLTMCFEDNNVTYSSFADNVNPTVSDLHNYWMRVCREGLIMNVTTKENVTEQVPANATVKIEEIAFNKTSKSDVNATLDVPADTATVTVPVETTSESSNVNTPTTYPPVNSTTISPIVLRNQSSCETFNCSWVEMCLPAIEVADRCSTPDCPSTRTAHRPCVRIKMCKSPSTPISTFATLNNTISRIDQLNTSSLTSVNDVANLTLISYVPPALPVSCSQNTSDPACQPPAGSGCSADGTQCSLQATTSVPATTTATAGVETSTSESTTNVPDLKPMNAEMAMLEELKQNLTKAYAEMEALRTKLVSDPQAPSS